MSISGCINGSVVLVTPVSKWMLVDLIFVAAMSQRLKILTYASDYHAMQQHELYSSVGLLQGNNVEVSANGPDRKSVV